MTEEASRLLGAESGLLLSYDENHASATVVGHYTELATPAFALGTTLPVEGDTLLEHRAAQRQDRRAGLLRRPDGRDRPPRRARASTAAVVAAPVVVAGRVWGLLVAATQRDEPLASNAEQRLEELRRARRPRARRRRSAPRAGRVAHPDRRGRRRRPPAPRA